MNAGKLILGTVQFGLDYGVNNTSGKPGQEAVNEILKHAYISGIICLDTAEAYGDAHEVIGRFHEAYPLMRFDIISKLPHQLDEDLKTKLARYLRQLKVDHLKGMLFHSYDTYNDNRSALKVLNSYKEKGTIEAIGVSIYTNAQMEDVINDENIDIIQLPFNLLDNLNLRKELLLKAKEKGKIIHTRSAFLQGLFFASLTKENKIIEDLKIELTQINNLSKEYNISIQKIALNYCLQQNLIDNVLIGVDNLSQLDQNLKDANFELPTHIIDEINTIVVKNADLLNPSLWN